jgi:hypothetical protein
MGAPRAAASAQLICLWGRGSNNNEHNTSSLLAYVEAGVTATGAWTAKPTRTRVRRAYGMRVGVGVWVWVCARPHRRVGLRARAGAFSTGIHSPAGPWTAKTEWRKGTEH